MNSSLNLIKDRSPEDYSEIIFSLLGYEATKYSVDQTYLSKHNNIDHCFRGSASCG